MNCTNLQAVNPSNRLNRLFNGTVCLIKNPAAFLQHRALSESSQKALGVLSEHCSDSEKKDKNFQRERSVDFCSIDCKLLKSNPFKLKPFESKRTCQTHYYRVKVLQVRTSNRAAYGPVRSSRQNFSISPSMINMRFSFWWEAAYDLQIAKLHLSLGGLLSVGSFRVN